MPFHLSTFDRNDAGLDLGQLYEFIYRLPSVVIAPEEVTTAPVVVLCHSL